MDISSLYTEIPNNEGLQTLKYLFFEPTSCWRTKLENLIPSELVLTLSCFSFLATTATSGNQNGS